jgi:mono/diheme cytochrome c family protein
MKASFVITGLILFALTGCSSNAKNAAGAGASGSAGEKQLAAGSGTGGMSSSASGTGGAGAGGASSGSGGAGAPAAPIGAAGWQAYMDMTPATLGSVERGEYLVDHILVCGVCHTPSLPSGEPDPMKYLAGSRPYDFTDLDGTVITVNAENLTSHDPEGLHAWTDGQIRTAITKGVDDEHYAIYPIMPYPEYSMLTPDDVDSIIKYLRSVPPNDNVVAADFPHPDINPPAPPVDDAKIPHTTLAKSDADYESAERGRYIAKLACLYCHTAETVVGGTSQADMPDLTKSFGGGKVYALNKDLPPHTSVNITPDATGIAGWTVDDIIAAVKSDTEKGTQRKLCNSHPGGGERFGKMTDADLKDVATYVHSLPPVKNGPFKCLQEM